MSTAVVDDRDTRIAYTGNWDSQLSDGGDYMGTVHRTSSSMARAAFVFNGTSVQVYGTLPPSRPPSSNYTLDDRAPVTFTSHNVSAPAFQQQLFASPQLPDGPHTLSVEPTLDGPNFYIDFFQYTASPASTSASPSGSHSGSDAGKIAGGVVGGIVALVMLSALLFMFLFRRKRRVNRQRVDLLATDAAPSPKAHRRGTDATPTPFLLPPPPSVSTTSGKLRHYPSIITSKPMTAPSPPGKSISAETTAELEPVRHRDGGAAPLKLQREELPPAYEDRVENL